ncbi:hypothetical protein [Mycobacterium simiae]|nr:hypothetical protein [Mycobacterium simiae]
MVGRAHAGSVWRLPAVASPAGAAGRVNFDPAELVAGDASKSDLRAVMDAVVALQQSWIGADPGAYVDRATSDVTRLTPWSGGIQSGPQKVAKGLPDEWGFLELATEAQPPYARCRRADSGRRITVPPPAGFIDSFASAV